MVKARAPSGTSGTRRQDAKAYQKTANSPARIPASRSEGITSRAALSMRSSRSPLPRAAPNPRRIRITSSERIAISTAAKTVGRTKAMPGASQVARSNPSRQRGSTEVAGASPARTISKKKSAGTVTATSRAAPISTWGRGSNRTSAKHRTLIASAAQRKVRHRLCVARIKDHYAIAVFGPCPDP